MTSLKYLPVYPNNQPEMPHNSKLPSEHPSKSICSHMIKILMDYPKIWQEVNDYCPENPLWGFLMMYRKIKKPKFGHDIKFKIFLLDPDSFPNAELPTKHCIYPRFRHMLASILEHLKISDYLENDPLSLPTAMFSKKHFVCSKFKTLGELIDHIIKLSQNPFSKESMTYLGYIPDRIFFYIPIEIQEQLNEIIQNNQGPNDEMKKSKQNFRSLGTRIWPRDPEFNKFLRETYADRKHKDLHYISYSGAKLIQEFLAKDLFEEVLAAAFSFKYLTKWDAIILALSYKDNHYDNNIRKLMELTYSKDVSELRIKALIGLNNFFNSTEFRQKFST